MIKDKCEAKIHPQARRHSVKYWQTWLWLQEASDLVKVWTVVLSLFRDKTEAKPGLGLWPVISAPRRLRREHCHEAQPNLGNQVRPCLRRTGTGMMTYRIS